jgi:hypothetical protein
LELATGGKPRALTAIAREAPPFEQFDAHIDDFEAPPGGLMGTREAQITFKTEDRDIRLELGREGKFTAKSSGWDKNRVSVRPTSSRSQSRTAAGCSALPAKLPEPKPVLHYFPAD